VAPFLVLFGATYFFSEFGPNTTTFVYPAEIFPVRVRTTSHGLGQTSAIVGFVALGGALTTVTTLPEPKGQSLEELTEDAKHRPTSATVLGLAESRGLRPPPA
jgi:hypothetical protein